MKTNIETIPTNFMRKKFLVFLGIYIGLVWMIDKMFFFISTKYDLSNSTRTFFSRAISEGYWTTGYSLIINWLPRLFLVFFLTKYFLFLVDQNPSEALVFKTERIGMVLLLSSALFFYQFFLKYGLFFNQLSFSDLFPNKSILFFFVYFFRFSLSALIEEITFRAGLFYSIKTAYSVHFSFLISIFCFGVSHVYLGPMLAMNSIVLGFFLTVVYHKTHNLFPGTSLHVANNVFHAYFNY